MASANGMIKASGTQGTSEQQFALVIGTTTNTTRRGTNPLETATAQPKQRDDHAPPEPRVPTLHSGHSRAGGAVPRVSPCYNPSRPIRAQDERPAILSSSRLIGCDGLTLFSGGDLGSSGE